MFLRALSFKRTHVGLNSLYSLNGKISSHSIAQSSRKFSVKLSGIYPPIPTPFNSDESIAYDKLEMNFQKWNKIPFNGYVVQGSNGEYVYLTWQERIDLIKKAKEFKSPDKLLLGDQDANDRALHSHYEKVASNSPVPVILYNVPANTGIELSVDAIVDLSQHDNIIGMKESGGDVTKIGSILHRTQDQDFQVLAGSVGFLLSSLQLGCVGGVCALANVLGREVCDLYQLFTEGSQARDEALSLQKKLIAPNAAVTKIFSVPGLKEVMDAKGYFGGPTRSPLQALTSEETKKLLSTFSAGGFL